LFIPRMIYEHGDPWQNDIDRVNWFIHQISLAFLPVESSSSKSGGTWRIKWWIWLSKYHSSCVKVIFYRRKILWHETDGFTSPPNDGVLHIFTALKFHRLLPGLNPRTLGALTGTITITPPRRRSWS
jgi:hypothetical protein